MSRNKELAKNTSYVVIGSIGAKLVSFLMLPLYTSWLSPSDYGLTDIIDTYSGLLLFIVALDITDAIFVFPIGATKENIDRYYTTGLFFTTVSCLTCAVVFYFLSLLNLSGEFFSNIWLIYGILVSSLFQKYTQDFCRGIKKMSVFTWTGVIQAFTLAIFSCILIPIWSVQGFVVACMLSYFLSGAFAFFYSKSYSYLSVTAVSYRVLKDMLAYSIPLVPTSIMWWLVASLNRPLMERYTGLFAIGLFAVANKLPSLMNLVFGFFQKAWVVTVVEEYKKADFSEYYNKMFRLVMSVQTFLCIIITAMARSFITIMTSEEYFEAWKFIPLLSLSVLLSNTSAFCGTLFNASRQTKYTFYSVCIGGIAAVLFNFMLIPYAGLWGACSAICLSHLLNMVSRIIFSSKMVTFRSTKYMCIQVAIILLVYYGTLLPSLPLMISVYILSLMLYYLSNKEIFRFLANNIRNRF